MDLSEGMNPMGNRWLLSGSLPSLKLFVDVFEVVSDSIGLCWDIEDSARTACEVYSDEAELGLLRLRACYAYVCAPQGILARKSIAIMEYYYN